MCLRRQNKNPVGLKNKLAVTLASQLLSVTGKWGLPGEVLGSSGHGQGTPG